jgi:hypothetical protein
MQTSGNSLFSSTAPAGGAVGVCVGIIVVVSCCVP